MRIPTPAALLVEHPVLPVPDVTGAVREPDDPKCSLLREARLSRRDRFCAALQLTSAVSHLVEFDLWPAHDAIRNARLARTTRGVSITLGRFPYPLSVAVDRLGGGEGAMERLRAAALERISDVLDLTIDEIDGPNDEPGLVFEGAIIRQLRHLPQPLDQVTARALWALRWNELPKPEAGVVQLWRVPRDDSARRMAGALWCRLRRDREAAWLWPAGDSGADTAPAPSLGDCGTLIVAGPMSQSELTALSRWSQRQGCAAAAIGTFPRGWRGSAPVVDNERLTRHIAVVGMSPAQGRRLIEDRQSNFDPLEGADRDALTTAIRRITAPPRLRGGARREQTPGTRLTRWLELSPGGLPTGFIALHTGMTAAEIDEACDSPDVIFDHSSVRLAEAPLLEKDSRHLHVAGLYGVDEPAHALHSALGTGDSSRLESWARGELDRLNSFSVRDVLSTLESGALGHGTQLLLAEACLSVLDLHGAQRALAGVPPTLSGSHRRWLATIDHRPGTPRELPTDDDIRSNPRIASEIALMALEESSRRGTGQRAEAREAAEKASRLVSEEVQNRIRIELAYILQPQRLADPGWGRKVAGDTPALKLQLVHRRAMAHLHAGRPGSARRLFEVLSKILIGPGFLGFVELDLGAVALEEGRSRDAAGHQLRAYRLLRAAGFDHLTNVALFDLAVADIDQLRVRQAAQRLSHLAATDPGDPFVIGEQARLQLAIGDEGAFRERLRAFEGAVDGGDPRFSEGLALLQGVAFLLDGDVEGSQALFERAGHEGRAWMELAAAFRGQPAREIAPDEWGVTRAAEFIRADEPERLPGAADWPDVGPPEGLALALAERLSGERLAVGAQTRASAIRRLRSAGLLGWAEHLSGIREHAGGLMTALARIVECGGVDGVEDSHLDRLLHGLEITGIEVLNATERTLIWRYGAGEAHHELHQGRLVIIPLGGDLVEGPGSRLVLGVLDLVLPQAVPRLDVDAEETGFFGVSEVARSLRRELRELGPSHLPVLLMGETGVGKEVAARALHRLSGRHGSFVAVNVAAIPGTLLEAELFGSVKGAFTGADRSRQGLVAAADGGTLFLDEVGDLDAHLQVKLLRFLESGEVRAVGSNQVRTVDVRIISATHADLAGQMREGTFRRDLYFRIAAPEVHVPPLRNRREDVALLKDLFEREAVARHGLTRPVWSPEADAALQGYQWPGNVRELRQVVEVAMVRASGSVVRCEHLPISSPEAAPSGTWDQAQRAFRRRFLSAALQRNGGNRSATARELGISRQALLYHLRILGMNDPPQH